MGPNAEYLRQQGFEIRRILVIANSNDFQRASFIWTAEALNCIDHNVCPPTDPTTLWLPVRTDETDTELLERTRARFSSRYPNFDWKNFVIVYIRQNSYLYKVGARALETLKAIIGGGARTPRKEEIRRETEAALGSLQSEKIPGTRTDGSHAR